MKKLIVCNDGMGPIQGIESFEEFHFYFFDLPVLVNGTVLGTNFDENSFEDFVSSVQTAINKARKDGLIERKASGQSTREYTEYKFLFKVLDVDGNEANTVGCMIRIALHQWGEIEKGSLSEEEKLQKAIAEIESRLPERMMQNKTVFVEDSGVSIFDGKEYGNEIIEIVSDTNPGLIVLTLNQARAKLEFELMEKWGLDLGIDW